MNELFQAIILGVVQGLAEFLPISSSGHLQIVPWLFGWNASSLTFDTALHIGTALAVSAYFFKEVLRLIKEKSPLLIYIILGNMPALLIGFLAENYIEELFHQGAYAIPITAIGLIIFGLIMLLVDIYSSITRNGSSSNLKDLLILGAMQAVALIPGVSRSGITITTGRALGFDRQSATYLSFLLGMPITVGAGLYKLLQAISNPSQLQEGLMTAFAGALASFVVGILCIKWLLNYVKTHPLKFFALYRVVVGITVLIVWRIKF